MFRVYRLGMTEVARKVLASACISYSFGLTACTPGSLAGGGALATSIVPASARTTTIDVNLTNDSDGYAPQIAIVAVGDRVRFHNSDGFAHTATSIAGSAFPSAYPFDGSALQARGDGLSRGFSTGSLVAGALSQTFVADVAGTYRFGCFYHYGSPMRATIEVR